MEIIYNLVDGKTLSYHVTAHAVRWVSKQNSRGGDTRPRLFINPVPPVGLEPTLYRFRGSLLYQLGYRGFRTT